MISLKPKRKAELEEYARGRGQDTATALDDALAAHLEWERRDFEEAVEGIRRGYEDVKAGRNRPPLSSLPRLALKHGFPGETSAEAEREAKAIPQWLLAHATAAASPTHE
jgi:hypothetical protein